MTSMTTAALTWIFASAILLLTGKYIGKAEPAVFMAGTVAFLLMGILVFWISVALLNRCRTQREPLNRGRLLTLTPLSVLYLAGPLLWFSGEALFGAATDNRANEMRSLVIWASTAASIILSNWLIGRQLGKTGAPLARERLILIAFPFTVSCALLYLPLCFLLMSVFLPMFAPSVANTP